MSIKMPFTQEMKKMVDSGFSINSVIEKTYSEDIEQLKRTDKGFEKLSPLNTVLAVNDIDPTYHTLGQMKGLLTLADGNDYLTPVFMIQTLEESMAETDVTNFLYGRDINIIGNVASYPYLDWKDPENKKAIRMSRVSEGADIPISKISLKSGTIETFKKAIGIGATYEALNDMRLDLVAMAIRAVSLDLSQQNVDDIVNVINKEASQLGDSTKQADVITNDELLTYLINFHTLTNKSANTIVAPDVFYNQVIRMIRPTDVAEGVSLRVSFNAPQLKLDNINVIKANVPKVGGKNVINIYNSDDMIKFMTTGSRISEQARYAKNQTEEYFISERSSFASFAPYAIKRIVSA